MDFLLHSVLAQDTHILHFDDSAYLLLHKNASIPWLIFVPNTKETELCGLESELYVETMERCRKISLWIQSAFKCEKVNFGALGNLVPQMHLHMVGRSKGDVCWPKPVWGNLDSFREYTLEDVAAIAAETARLF